MAFKVRVFKKPRKIRIFQIYNWSMEKFNINRKLKNLLYKKITESSRRAPTKKVKWPINRLDKSFKPLPSIISLPYWPYILLLPLLIPSFNPPPLPQLPPPNPPSLHLSSPHFPSPTLPHSPSSNHLTSDHYPPSPPIISPTSAHFP